MDLGFHIGKDQLVGIEAYPGSDGSWCYGWLHVRLKKGALHVLRQGRVEQSTAELARVIGVRYPVVVVIRGDRVLLRDHLGAFDTKRDLNAVLPNARPEELAICQYPTGERTLVAMTRIALVSELLDPLEALGFRSQAIHLGPGTLFALPHDPADPDTFTFGPHRFEHVASGAWNYDWNANHKDGGELFGDERIMPDQWCALAACWQQLLSPLACTSATVAAVERGQQEERSRQHYEKGTIALLAALLVFFIADMALRKHTTTRAVILQEAMAQEARVRAELDSLESAIRSQRELVTMSGIDANGVTLDLLDQVAGSVPKALRLTEMWWAPASTRQRSGAGFERTSGLLTIRGTAPDPTDLPAWSAALEELPRVTRARLHVLTQGNEREDPLFELHVQCP